MALTDKLSAIGEAIRAKTGKSEMLTLDQMPGEIAGITGGGGDLTLLEGLSFELDFSNGDMPFAAPSGYAVKSAIVKQPATLIPANIKSGVEVAGIVGTFEGGGGANPDANDPVYYVTFMNGDQKLYVRPVVRGENCTDVVANNIIPAPTKESDVQYSYTYYGWGASDGGGSDTNILKNITKDKTVYAIYSKTLQTYTITYLDDDGSVLKEETLTYGATPGAYYPQKLGFQFTEWTPAITSVTGNATYTAVWSETSVRVEEITDSWEEIVAAVNDGTYKTKYAIGNYKPITSTYANGATYNMQIVAFDKDELSNGSGFASITWIAMGTVNGYKDALQSGGSSTMGWSNCTIITRIPYMSLPTTITSAVKEVKKYQNERVNGAIQETVSKVKYWVPSRRELFDTSGSGPSYPEVYSSNAARLKGVGLDETPVNYWLRDFYSYSSGNTFYYYAVGTSGTCITLNGYKSNQADWVLGFCM